MSPDNRDPFCPSCGVHYSDHLGLIGTCAELLAVRQELSELAAAAALYEREGGTMTRAWAKRAAASTTHTADEVQRATMWRQCPVCGSPEGTYCVTEFGLTAYTPHKARTTAALRALDAKRKTP